MQVTRVMGSLYYQPLTLMWFLWIFLPEKHLVSFKKRRKAQAINPRKHFSVSPPNSHPFLPVLACKGMNKFLALRALKLGRKNYKPFDLYRETEAQAGEIPHLSQQQSATRGPILPP